ncbi:hypothetical protein BGZ93_008872 [Podila epicladia]|nr:hypothetical protein BGZ92_004946 [Podila epicladia]KAG0091359.1 hypothetical protein BGZ93_008872 [Podila epicladia]
MFYNDVSVGHVETPYVPVTVTDSDMMAIMAAIPLVVPVAGHDAFAALAKELFTSESVPLPLTGKMDLTFTLPTLPSPFKVPTAPKSLNGIGLEIEVRLPGLNGLPDIKFISLIENTADTANTKQTISFKINVKVATKLGVKLGDIMFNTAGPAGPIGTTTFKEFSVEHGDNTIDTVTVVDLSMPGAADFVRELDTADGVLTLTGFADSTQNPAIVSGLEALHLTIVVPKKFGV